MCVRFQNEDRDVDKGLEKFRNRNINVRWRTLSECLDSIQWNTYDQRQPNSCGFCSLMRSPACIGFLTVGSVGALAECTRFPRRIEGSSLTTGNRANSRLPIDLHTDFVKKDFDH